jgi:hypothetical protein
VIFETVVVAYWRNRFSSEVSYLWSFLLQAYPIVRDIHFGLLSLEFGMASKGVRARCLLTYCVFHGKNHLFSRILAFCTMKSVGQLFLICLGCGDMKQ